MDPASSYALAGRMQVRAWSPQGHVYWGCDRQGREWLHLCLEGLGEVGGGGRVGKDGQGSLLPHSRAHRLWRLLPKETAGPPRARADLHPGQRGRAPKSRMGERRRRKRKMRRGRERRKGLLPEQEACGSLMAETQPASCGAPI